ncbi:MAG: TadE/TadG family type IV pilus assembly protein [Acidimicrobiales bacterium]
MRPGRHAAASAIQTEAKVVDRAGGEPRPRGRAVEGPGRRGHARGKGERGAALVEFAIVVPVLCLLLFGIIDFGTLYSNQISVRQGVREAARQAAVDQFGANSTCTLSATVPTSPSLDMRKLACLTKNRVGLSDSAVAVMVWFDSSAPFNTSNATNTPVVVCAITAARSITGFSSRFLGNAYIKSKVEMTIEQNYTAGDSTQVGSMNIGIQEVDPSGGNWSFCLSGGSTP